jgi:ligand-binding sensor domain-containing protein
MDWISLMGPISRFYRHKPGDSTSLQANEILALHEDKAGNLWVGTSGGSLSLYDRRRDALSTLRQTEAQTLFPIMLF